MKNYFTKLGTAMFLFSTLFVCTACPDDDPDDPVNPKIDIEATDANAKMLDLKIEETIDREYSPSTAEIQKTWLGEYEGWDENQKKNTTIKRMLILNGNGTYSNIIQGKLIASGKEDFFDFEHEQGTYTYNAGSKTITYTVKTDSVLKYDEQKMIGYTKKKYYDSEKGTYTESAQFSIMGNNGTRRWITRDTYLQSLTDKSIKIAFAMDPMKSTDKPRN